MRNAYNRHIEFVKNEPDVNPATGEVKSKTVTDFYVCDDRVTMWGWGYVKDFKPNESYPTLDALLKKMVDIMLADGHRILRGKRFRDAEGQLTATIPKIKEMTKAEADDYYIPGKRYRFEGAEYTLESRSIGKTTDGKEVEMVKFISDDKREIFVGANSLGTFLPDVARSGNEIFLIEPSALNDLEMEEIEFE